MKFVLAAIFVAVAALLLFVFLNPTPAVGEEGAQANVNGTFVVSRTLADLFAALVSW